MKVIYALFAFIILVALGIFVFQNWESVDLKFLKYQMTMPVSFVSVIFYLLGTFSGTLIINVLRKATNRKNND